MAISGTVLDMRDIKTKDTIQRPSQQPPDLFRQDLTYRLLKLKKFLEVASP